MAGDCIEFLDSCGLEVGVFCSSCLSTVFLFILAVVPSVKFYSRVYVCLCIMYMWVAYGSFVYFLLGLFLGNFSSCYE